MLKVIEMIETTVLPGGRIGVNSPKLITGQTANACQICRLPF